MRKRYRSSLLIVIGLCALLVTAWKFTPREPLLMEKATDVSPQGVSYCWLNNEELLRTRQGQTGGVLLRRNIRTGQETAPDALKKCEEAITGLQPSPDGKYLLWSEQGEVGGNYGLAVADGSHYFAQKSIYATLWMPDSRHWLEFKANENQIRFDAILHNIETQGENRTLAIEKQDAQRGFNVCLVTPDKRLLVRGDSSSNPKKNAVQIDEYAIGSAIKYAGSHSFNLPAGTTLANEITDVVASPDGRWVALHLTSQRVSSLSVFVARYLPFLKAEPQERIELWISDLDGRNQRLLGYVIENSDVAKTRNSPTFITPGVVQDIAWTPDGKKISFTDQGRIYTIPVDVD